MEIRDRFCRNCGAELGKDAKFCTECGVKIPVPDEKPAAPKKAPDDKGLKLLVDCCSKTMGLPVSNGLDETVLYLNEQTGEYQIHTYNKMAGQPTEFHRAFKADNDVYEKIIQHINELELTKYDGVMAGGMTGGEYVVKFVIGEKVYRITTSNVPYQEHNKLYDVGSLLGSLKGEEIE